MEKNEDKSFTKYLICDCCDKEHMVYLQKFDWEDDTGICEYSIGVSKSQYKNFISRFKIGIKYIFNIKDNTGFYAEILVNDKVIDDMQDFIDDYKKYRENK